MKKRILIVEDESLISDAIERGFESIDEFDFECDVAMNLDDFCEEGFGTRYYDAVVIDLSLAGAPSYQGFHFIKYYGAMNDVIVVAYSGHCTNENVKAAWKAGADEFLNKAVVSPHEVGGVLTDEFVMRRSNIVRQEERMRLLAGKFGNPPSAQSGSYAVVIAEDVVALEPTYLDCIRVYEQRRIENPSWPDDPPITLIP